MMLPPKVCRSTMAAVGAIMRGWREMIRSNAENIVLARTPIGRKFAEQMIEDFAAGQELMMPAAFASPSPA